METLNAIISAFRTSGASSIRITRHSGFYVEVVVDTEDQLRGWAQSIKGTAPTYHGSRGVLWLESTYVDPEMVICVMTRPVTKEQVA